MACSDERHYRYGTAVLVRYDVRCDLLDFLPQAARGARGGELERKRHVVAELVVNTQYLCAYSIQHATYVQHMMYSRLYRKSNYTYYDVIILRNPNDFNREYSPSTYGTTVQSR